MNIRLDQPLPDTIETGLGQYLVVSGECISPRSRVERLAVSIGGEEHEAEISRIPGGVRFWQAVIIPPERNGSLISVDAALRLADKSDLTSRIGECYCRDVVWESADSPESGGGPSELVAICMATFRPEQTAFQRQIDSIRAQSYDNWVCIVQDDGTSDAQWLRMQDYCAEDQRFLFVKNPRNLGFYRNFERALARVPVDATYVALADQDDHWYADKLDTLISRLRSSNAALVYSDMRIVDSSGHELAPSYWVNRRNEFSDPDVVLVANTVTGAASLFKAEILKYLLPFPPRVGDAFHDHWLACICLSIGKLDYIDRPLYDYYQYGQSVIGHCDFTRFSLSERLVSLVRFCFRMCRPSMARPLLKQKYSSALAIYRGECRRLRLIEGTIRQRCHTDRPRFFAGGPGSVMKLLTLHAKVLIKGQTTDDAELRLAMGELARIVEKRKQG